MRPVHANVLSEHKQREIKLMAETTTISTSIDTEEKAEVKQSQKSLSPKTLSILDDVEYFLANEKTSKIAYSMFLENLHDLAIVAIGLKGKNHAKVD